MKCPKCGQNILNNTDYCVNCGKELNVVIKEGITLQNFAVIIAIFLVGGALLILGIMYWGTDNEIDSYIENKN